MVGQHPHDDLLTSTDRLLGAVRADERVEANEWPPNVHERAASAGENCFWAETRRT